jgi:hypothetical protein
VRYELRIPRARLPGVDLEPGAVLGFTYAAIDADGLAPPQAIEWTPGLAGARDPSQYGDLLLRVE